MDNFNHIVHTLPMYIHSFAFYIGLFAVWPVKAIRDELIN
jgi:hypothetical protein